MTALHDAMTDIGLTAFRSGRWREARDAFEQALVTRPDDASLLGRLAAACLKLDDPTAAHAAANSALTLNAREMRAALTKADLLWAEGARREANIYYRGVIEIGGASTNPLDPDLADGVARARRIAQELVAGMQAELRAELHRAGFIEGRSNGRFTHAYDLLTGKRNYYAPQPKAFFYPDLPNWQFYPRDLLPWADAIDAATADITAELEGVLRDDAGFDPYLRTVPGMPNQSGYPLIDSMDWSTCFLFRDGAETAHAARCPRTMAAMAQVPLARVAGRSPQVMFSQLKAGAHIRPHTGFVNTRLTCHLPLIIPPGCQFRVGNEVREWKVGQMWAFDDTIEHEAINRSDRTRVVLIFDIWRPELSEEERLLIATLLETLDAYSPRTVSWE